jgi:hypothetical protein
MLPIYMARGLADAQQPAASEPRASGPLAI